MPAIKSNKATAFFSATTGQSSIDKDNGILRGVKLMERGCVAQFKGDDGSPKKVTITDAHISALLAHAGNRAIPIHETHEWFDAEGKSNADSVERAARLGSLKSIRRDTDGNLVADAFLNLDKQPARDLLFGAEHNPEDNCFSVVFSYAKDDPQCMPMNFRAADIVPSGAATTALFSEATDNTSTMDIQELLSALDDPKVKAAVKAILKSHTGPEDDTPDEKTEGAAMESEAGVAPEDKKDDDEQKPALMRAMIRVSRAVRRQTAALKADRTALLADAKRDAEASHTALLGKSGFLKQSASDATGDEVETYIATQVASGATRGVAILRLAKDKSDLYNTARAAGKI